MIDLPESIALPMKMDEQGAIRISGTRVTLDTLIARYQQGDTPEAIHDGFPSVSLTDIYMVIAYYLANRGEIDKYLARREAEAKELQQKIETNYTSEQQKRQQRLRSLIDSKHH